MSYQLSVNQPCHTRDLRCLDYYNGLLVTGGSDKLVKIYTTKSQKIEEITTVTIFEKSILSIKINRKNPSQIMVLVGCTDGKIYGLDHSGNPISIFQHDSPISSLDFINSQYFVSGSWDGKAIVWHLASRKKISQYAKHKHAVSVFYNELNDSVVSGSQDKALAIWSWKDGKQIKRREGAHNDIIRQISSIPQVGFITCSNDQTIKTWTSQLEEMNHLIGQHSAFVFGVKSVAFGSYISCGDDKSIRIWHNESVIQTLQCPASVWSVALDQAGQIYAGCTDGYLRVFTTNPQKKAPLSTIQAYNKQVLNSASKKSGMSAEQISKLANVSSMANIKGKKEGQIRVFKNGLIPQAYMWQNSKWVKIGEVITQNTQAGGGGMSQSRYYPGDKYFQAGQYDYIFDVDDESGMHKQIPFNDGANALEAAQKYCMRQGLTKGYIQQIRKFLMQNSSKIPRKAIKNTQKQVSSNSLKSTPVCIPIQYGDIKNPAAVVKKITQFNEKMVGNTKLTDRQIQHCNRIAGLLQNSKNYHSWKLDFKQMDTIKKLLQWPSQYKLPVWDILRAFLCHYQSQALFSGLDAGFDIVSQLASSLQKQNSQGFYSLIFRTLNNVMIQNTNKNGIVKCNDIIFNSIQKFSKRTDLKNKNLLTAIAGFLFNFSVTVFQKKIENEQIISAFARILNQRLQIDDDEQNRLLMLQAASNVIFKYQQKRNEFTFVKKYLGNNQVSQDLELLLG